MKQLFPWLIAMLTVSACVNVNVHFPPAPPANGAPSPSSDSTAPPAPPQ